VSLQHTEPEEVERLRFPEALSSPAGNRLPSKLNEPRLVGMKSEPEACEPCFEISKELLCLMPMLEADDGVVRIAHDDHPAGDASLPPPVDPQIVDVVEVDVRQQRADDSALRRPLLRFDQLAFFENPCCQPLADQSYDPAIADTVLDKTDQPLLADRIEGSVDRLPISAMSRLM